MKLTKLFLTAGVVSLSIAALVVSKAADKQRVFALVPKTISVPFYNDVERGMTDEAKKLGVVGKFIGPTTADAALQVQVLQDLVSQGVDGIAVAPMDADSVIGVISQARKKGIPVITFDSDSPKADRIAFVGTNNLGGGQEGGKAFKSLLPKGKFAIITGGLAAANLNDRIKGFRDKGKHPLFVGCLRDRQRGDRETHDPGQENEFRQFHVRFLQNASVPCGHTFVEFWNV